MLKIEIYTQPFCPYCAKALALLRKKGVEFQEIDAPAGSVARAEAAKRANGKTSVPQIFVDGQLIGGCDDLLGLEREHKLDAILQL